jgi:archaemetzincin
MTLACGAPERSPQRTDAVIAEPAAEGPLAEDPRFDDPAFTPLGPPPPGGWRTRVDEEGQRLADYLAEGPNRPTPPRATLVLQPLAPFPSRVLLPGDLPSVKIEEDDLVTFVFSPAPDELAALLAAFYGLHARVAPTRPLDSLAVAPTRVRGHHGQFDARALLAASGPSLPDDAYSMTLLLARDLLVEERQEYAFGYGLHVDRLALVSFARLDPQFSGGTRSPEFQTRVRERSYKLVAHEVGHTLGFGHCDVHACVMNGFAHLAELDATPLRLCPECLRKLLWVVAEADNDASTALLRRYRELAARYEAAGLEDDLAWVRGRIERLESHREPR